MAALSSMVSNPNSEAISAFQVWLKPAFPKQGYGADKSLVAHYLVFNGGEENLKALREWLSKPEKMAERVSAFVTSKKLTILHIAVMSGRADAAACILTHALSVIDINKRDDSGWTALHFACAINHTALIALLRNHGAQEVKNSLEGTPTDIHRMLYLQKRPEDQQFFYQNNEKNIVPGNGYKFCELTGAVSYADEENRFPFALIMQQWLEPIGRYDSLSLELRLKWGKVRTSDWVSKVYLKRSEPIGWEVVLREPVKKGDVLCEYLGAALERESVRSDFETGNEYLTYAGGDYVLHSIDAKGHRSLAAMINDGLPNCKFVLVSFFQGTSERYILQALEDLPEGTVLRIDYMLGHRCKFGPHIEADWDAVIGKYRELFSKDVYTKDDSRILYALVTPALMVSLFVQEIVSLDKIIKLWKDFCKDNEKLLEEEVPLANYFMSQVLLAIKQLAPYLSSLNSKQKEVILLAAHSKSVANILDSMRLVCPAAEIAALMTGEITWEGLRNNYKALLGEKKEA
jgi:hypothetical protein